MARTKRLSGILIILGIAILALSGMAQNKSQAEVKPSFQGSSKSGVADFKTPPDPQVGDAIQFHPENPCQPGPCDPETYLAFLQEMLLALWNDKGIVLSQELKRYGAADEAFDEALKIDPQNRFKASVYNNKALNWHLAGENKKAIEWAEKAVTLQPDLCQAWNTRGNAFFKLGQTERAIASYSESLKINPEYDKGYYNRGVAYVKANESAKAFNDIAKAVQLNPAFKNVARNDEDYRPLRDRDKARFEEIVK